MDAILCTSSTVSNRGLGMSLATYVVEYTHHTTGARHYFAPCVLLVTWTMYAHIGIILYSGKNLMVIKFGSLVPNTLQNFGSKVG